MTTNEALPGPSKGRTREWRYLAGILATSFLIRLPFLMSTGFFSDESVYTYSAYAVLRGSVPYEGIMLPHPPLGYLGIAALVFVSSENLVLLRACYLVLFLIIGLLTYVFLATLRDAGSSPFNPLGAVVMLTVYPIPYSLTTPLEFILFEIPVLLSLVFAVKGIVARSIWRLIISGALMAAALMIWYPAVFVAIAVVTFALIYFARKNSWRESVKLTLPLIVGGLVATGMALLLIALFGDLSNFVLQSISLQSSLRADFTLAERLRHVWISVLEFLPMIILGIVGAAEIIRRAVSRGDLLSLLPVYLYILNFTLISTVPRVVLSHYFAYLTPFLAYFASGPVETLFKRLFLVRIDVKAHVPSSLDFYKSIIAVFMIVLVLFVPLYGVPRTTGFLSTNQYTVAEQSVAASIAKMTGPGDRIWTSEGAIAYFASRLIVSPNSSKWPIQAMYNDVFNATYIDADGVNKTGLGIVSPSQFMQSWSHDRTKILVFILGPGPIPYPDDFLWNGFGNTAGVRSWVEMKYDLNATFVFPEVDYTYKVWAIK